ncbi:helix-turn-helix transcriptional regulator [Archangium primigenium]|uniref:helix-turn-helix transcriptional regulator n=1 Tax=[Archangium] primigenium TaxID=2792470 RepID=UPI001957640F|nr:helix-turn-helix domain-containing protein [Archangium primigenium]MBM7119521.1 helix-turn-helix domain-containing protein [Archangium primigenium]
MSYSTKDIAKILGVTDRTVRRYLKSFISFDNKGIEVSEKMLEILIKEYNSGQETDNSGQLNEIPVDYDIVEGFSTEEYQEFQKRLIEYPVLKQELEYHKKSAESHQRQMEKILSIMQERNLLEASNNPNFLKK